MASIQAAREAAHPSSTRFHAWSEVFVVAGLVFLLAIALQIKAGAYTSEFDYDENSHYV